MPAYDPELAGPGARIAAARAMASAKWQPHHLRPLRQAQPHPASLLQGVSGQALRAQGHGALSILPTLRIGYSGSRSGRADSRAPSR